MKKNRHHDHIPFTVKGNRNVVFSVWARVLHGELRLVIRSSRCLSVPCAPNQVPLKPPNIIPNSNTVQSVPNYPPMMPRRVRLSNGYTPDRKNSRQEFATIYFDRGFGVFGRDCLPVYVITFIHRIEKTAFFSVYVNTFIGT